MKIATVVTPLLVLLQFQPEEVLSQQKETLFQVSDFTKEGLFTSGIEGPAVDAEGNLYAVNFEREGTVGKVLQDGTVLLFVELPAGSIGNSICFARNGDMRIADYSKHNILQVDMRTKHIIVYAHDSSMNQPNDICIAKNNTLYASDPRWADGTGNLWMINNDGRTVLLEDSMGTTNGIEISPDEKYLYVNESVQRNVWKYDIAGDGTISNKRLLIQFTDGGMDGMKCDRDGNLYIARYGKGNIAVVSPDGKILREIALSGNMPTNITFGGSDGTTCYVTMQDRGCIETFQAVIPGKKWK